MSYQILNLRKVGKMVSFTNRDTSPSFVLYDAKANKIWTSLKKRKLHQCNGMEISLFLDKYLNILNSYKMSMHTNDQTNDTKQIYTCSVNSCRLLEEGWCDSFHFQMQRLWQTISWHWTFVGSHGVFSWSGRLSLAWY